MGLCSFIARPILASSVFLISYLLFAPGARAGTIAGVVRADSTHQALDEVTVTSQKPLFNNSAFRPRSRRKHFFNMTITTERIPGNMYGSANS